MLRIGLFVCSFCFFFFPDAVLRASQNENTLDESRLDEKTLSWINMARARQDQDPRMKKFREDFERELFQLSKGWRTQTTSKSWVVVTGQLLLPDGSIPNLQDLQDVRSTCKILDYGIFIGFVYKRMERNADKYTAFYDFFDKSYQYQKISKQFVVPDGADIVNVGKVSLRLSKEETFVTMEGVVDMDDATSVTSVGIRFSISTREHRSTREESWDWYPVSGDGSFTLGPFPPDGHYFVAVKKKDGTIIERQKGILEREIGLSLNKKDKPMEIKIAGDDLHIAFGGRGVDEHLSVRARADRGKWTNAVKLWVEEFDRDNKTVVKEEFREFSRLGMAFFEGKDRTRYRFSLLDENDEVLTSSSYQFLRTPVKNPLFWVNFAPPKAK